MRAMLERVNVLMNTELPFLVQGELMILLLQLDPDSPFPFANEPVEKDVVDVVLMAITGESKTANLAIKAENDEAEEAKLRSQSEARVA